MPNLPAARVMWKPAPDLLTEIKCQVRVGGAHHSVFTTQVTARMIEDWADIMGIEVLSIAEETTTHQLKETLFLAHLVWKLR